MDFKKYPKYKPSGVEWIGEIPEDWEIIKLKYALANLESGSRETGGGSIAEGVFSLGGEHIGWLGELLLDSPKYVSENYYNNLRTGKIKNDDVLLVKDGATIGKCAIITEMPFSDCAVNEHVFILRVNKSYFSKYLFYFVWCRIGQEQILQNVRGSAQPGLNSQFINEVIIPFPPKLEQTAIANFLDDKTTKIDTLIEKKKKLIELLKEERTAVINDAVTGKTLPLNKGETQRGYKDSGIEWLGQIPEHWQVKKLRYIGSCQNGVSKGAEYFGSGFPFMSYGVVYNNEEISSTLNDLAKSSERDRVVYSVNEGDIFFTRTSETIEEIGIASTCMKTIIDATFSGFLIRVRINKDILYKGFSKYYFRCQKHRNFFVKEMNIVTRASLSQDLLKNLPVLLPPFNEQIQIFEFLEAETKRIDGTIQKIEKEIELLKEYRTALISEVVTGKIKVI